MAWFRCSNGGSSPAPAGGDYQSLIFEIENDVYIDYDGSEKPYSGWSTTSYIEVPSGETIYLAGIKNTYNAWYDESKQFISAINPGDGVISVPNNAKYARFSEATAKVEIMKVFKEVDA